MHVPLPLTTVITQMTLLPSLTVTVPLLTGTRPAFAGDEPGCAAAPALDEPDDVHAASARFAPTSAIPPRARIMWRAIVLLPFASIRAIPAGNTLRGTRRRTPPRKLEFSKRSQSVKRWFSRSITPYYRPSGGRSRRGDGAHERAVDPGRWGDRRPGRRGCRRVLPTRCRLGRPPEDRAIGSPGRLTGVARNQSRQPRGSRDHRQSRVGNSRLAGVSASVHRR